MPTLTSVFQDKYTEFATELAATLPELRTEITAALALKEEDRKHRWVTEVLPGCGPTRDPKSNPGLVLPGVTIPNALWDVLSDKSQAAIQEFLTLLAFCSLYTAGSTDLSGNPLEGMGAWSEEFLKGWKEKMGSLDFESISKKIAELVGGLGPDKLPKIPERLLKGHLAKLAEELVREFKPEDFGLSPEELAACDSDPTRAFTLLTEIYTKKPEVLQKAIQRIASRLQDKVKRGELRPEQIAAEAEELMKEFSQNGSFVELLGAFKGMFNMEDMDVARQAGREGDARRNIVKERLRKKLEAKKGGKK
jgi:hypothetical protein